MKTFIKNEQWLIQQLFKFQRCKFFLLDF